MAEAQTAQARVYNRGAQPREFAPGDKVLVLVPTSECKFLAKWTGPYEVIEKVGHCENRAHPSPDGRAIDPEPATGPPGPVHPEDVFSAEAGHTDLIQHRIVKEPGKRVKLRPYRIPEARREAIAAEERSKQSFGAIKDALCSEPVLVTPDFSQPLVVQTNASETGVGAVLSQLHEDHAPLVWMSRNKDNNARVTRWFLSLRPYAFDIVHRSGAAHGNADALSRRDALGSWATRPPGRS
ncbi:hypothetical protein SKAU_G00019960 [Synaphobranchus kaupii]|uniref:Reverse transcriptase/retrotransposon-derived protein RNase H-like domain-containing protein n=1 Tax=Synaphobranchus kaupii TaxID=118154 RepID=A0A9Q1GCM8_SYNKA|nr:hypothetical protein SKAU_G00019960 [Synaphobranchus kaupii]